VFGLVRTLPDWNRPALSSGHHGEAVRQNALFGARVIKICVDCKRWGYTTDEIQLFISEAAKAGLEVVNELDFGTDYAETLRRWRADFLRQDRSVRQLGFDTRFMRIWEFYLAYCEAAFALRNISVVHTLHTRANNLSL
jgi:hypothetical protein